MPAKVLSGARATVQIYDGKTTRNVGIFSDISYGVTYDVLPAFILGRYSAAELDYTAMEVVHITANGFRIVDHGWFADAMFPSLSQLMGASYLTFFVLDRQTGVRIAKIDSVRPVGATGGFTARQLSTSTHSYMGLLVSDESEPDNNETAGASVLP